MDLELKKIGIKRDSKYNLGKKMGNQLWFHKSYADEIIDSLDFDKALSLLPKNFNYEIIRYNEQQNEIAFIECNDFNDSNEPIVGASCRINLDNKEIKINKQPNDPLIYHHKWTFVKDDYKGFDVQESKKRSLEWKIVLGVNKEISNKIGRLSFWDNWLKENNLMSRDKKELKDFLTKKTEKRDPIWSVYENVDSSTQEIDSKGTARLQHPRSLKIIQETGLFKENTKLFDIGCGNNNDYFKEGIESLGIKYYGCDPFNKPKEENLLAIDECMNGGVSLITSNNVLNTIKEPEIRKNVLEQCKNACSDENGIVIIIVYEGMKTSKELKKEKETGEKLKELTPIKTRDGWQNRFKTEDYLREIESVFPNVKIQSINGSKFIAASTNPSLDLDLRKKIKVKNKNKIK